MRSLERSCLVSFEPPRLPDLLRQLRGIVGERSSANHPAQGQAAPSGSWLRRRGSFASPFVCPADGVRRGGLVYGYGHATATAAQAAFHVAHT
jgi:hypothetical protein